MALTIIYFRASVFIIPVLFIIMVSYFNLSLARSKLKLMINVFIFSLEFCFLALCYDRNSLLYFGISFVISIFQFFNYLSTIESRHATFCIKFLHWNMVAIRIILILEFLILSLVSAKLTNIPALN